MKKNRSGQSEVITDSDYRKIRACIKHQKYKLLLDIARYTGERWGAIVELKTLDVFDPNGSVRSHITFKAQTRSPHGTEAKTRSIPIHSCLQESLLAYGVGTEKYLFPSSDGTKHISVRAADLMLRSAITKANLNGKGYSTHSTRKTFIARLWHNGVDVRTIQALTGHSDLKALMSYIKPDPQRIKKAIAHL